MAFSPPSFGQYGHLTIGIGPRIIPICDALLLAFDSAEGGPDFFLLGYFFPLYDFDGLTKIY